MRARQIESEEQTIHHLKVEEQKRQREKRLLEDKCECGVSDTIEITQAP